jgi:hypothetical protein
MHSVQAISSEHRYILKWPQGISTSSLRVELYDKCVRILKETEDIPDDSEFLRIEAAVHPSDADLFDGSVSLDRWLLRATLRTSYRFSYDRPNQRHLVQCRNEVHRRNIDRLRRALPVQVPLGTTEGQLYRPSDLGSYQLTHARDE